MKEFDLSEKIGFWIQKSIPSKDVKEFIRLLKEKATKKIIDDNLDVEAQEYWIKKSDLDHLAGKKLR